MNRTGPVAGADPGHAGDAGGAEKARKMSDTKLSEEIARAAVVARDERPDYQLVEEWAERVSDLEKRLEAALATDLRCEHCGETYQTTCGAELQAERDDLEQRLQQAERERDEAHQIAEADRCELRARRAIEEHCRQERERGRVIYIEPYRTGVCLRVAPSKETLAKHERLLSSCKQTMIADALGLKWRKP